MVTVGTRFESLKVKKVMSTAVGSLVVVFL